MTKYKFDPPASNSLGWFVSVSNDDELCLHSDGEVREGVKHGYEWTGYFPTKRDASLAIVRYMDKQEFEG